jgi:hypothetical protein
MDLPIDLIELIEVWLKESFIGSILGPILYAIFVVPMLNLESMLSFADNWHVSKCNKSLKAELIKDMENLWRLS